MELDVEDREAFSVCACACVECECEALLIDGGACDLAREREAGTDTDRTTDIHTERHTRRQSQCVSATNRQWYASDQEDAEFVSKDVETK